MIALGTLLESLRQLADAADLTHPSKGHDAKDLDNHTVAQYCKNFTDRPIGLEMANFLTRALLGFEADEVSMLYLVHYIKSGSGIDNLISDQKDGAQYLRCRQGEF